MRMKKIVSILCSMSIFLSFFVGSSVLNVSADIEKGYEIIYDAENSTETSKVIRVYFRGFDATHGGTIAIDMPDELIEKFESVNVETPFSALSAAPSKVGVNKLHMLKCAMAMGSLGTSEDNLFMEITIELNAPLANDWRIELNEDNTIFIDPDGNNLRLSTSDFGYETVTIEAGENTDEEKMTESPEPDETSEPESTLEPTEAPKATKKPSSGGGGGGSSRGGSSPSSSSAKTSATASPTAAPTEEPSSEPETTIAPDEFSGSPITEEFRPASFTDLEEAAWARDAVIYLAERGIVNGRSETAFEPNGEITRAEFAKLVAAAYGFVLNNDTESKFTDVNEDDWFAPYVLAAADKGIVTGYPDNTFKPNNRVLRQEMAVMIYRAQKAFDLELTEVNEEKVWDDEVPDWASDAVTSLQKAGIINGMTQTTFGGGEPSTRAQAAQMIYNLFVSAN